MTGRNHRTERVRKTMMDDGEYRRGGRGGKGNEAQTPRSAQRNSKSMEDLGKEKVNRKEQSNFQLRAAAWSRSALNRSDAQPKTATVFGRRPDPSPERENGKETANGGVQPRTIPDASAEASIGRSESREPKWKGGGNEPQTKMLKRQFRDAEGRSRGYPKCRDGKMSGWRVPERKAKMNECRRGMDVGERKLLGGMDRKVGQDSEAKQQGTTMTQPNSAGRIRGVQEQIRSGSESSEGKETREEQREEVATGNIGESAGGMFMKNEKPGGGPSKAPKVWWSLGRCRPEGMTEVRRIRTKVGSGNATYELQQHTRGVRNQSRAKTESSERNLPRGRGEWQRKTAELLTESRRAEGSDRAPERCSRNAVTTYRIWQAQSDNATCKLQQHPRDVRNRKDRDRGSEGNFAKNCEGNRRRAPKIAGGANRGLEGLTERDFRLKRSLGDARPKGDRNPGEPEEGQRIWPGPGEDVWDFGKDVRDPERPESFSGASLGNRKSQNTIRTSLSTNGKDRGRAEATGSTGRFRSKPKGEGEERNGSGGRAEWNRVSHPPKVKALHKPTTVMCAASRGGQNRLRVCDCLAFGCEKNGREEKGVVNDRDRSRSRGRAEDRSRPEISRVDGEVARADGSTEGQRPEVVRTEVGGRTGGEPEVIGTESK
ncbi:hypothetical protein DFH06DRAFT_1122841 [Mycena polygramma]|nr:hypothetical protein DFH06DRAFT_1122841 [Mycena polygramma]